MLNYLKASKTILGLNARNLIYTIPENPRESRLIADHKLKAKRILGKAGITVPKTYARIRNMKELTEFDWNKLPSSFALKPNKGFYGKGILVVYGEKKRKSEDEEREWIRADGSRVGKDFLYSHIVNILEGTFSLRNSNDRAFFEERLKNIPELKPFLYKGVPDVRVIVYNKVPIMAELRLPTKESQGKANLHAGGVGVGIDIASGITTIAIQHDKIIDVHPDSKMKLSGFTIPYWNKILEMAINAQIATGLGYVGADIAIDRDLGPVMLEINARPGLAIQIANAEGLIERLDRVKKLKIRTPEKGIRIAKELFGGEVEEEVETIIGKKILGMHSPVLLFGKEKTKEEIIAKIDTGASFSSIDNELARRLGYEKVITDMDSLSIPTISSYANAKEIVKSYELEALKINPDIQSLVIIKSSNGITIRPIIEIPIRIEDSDRKARVTVIDRTGLRYPMILGSRDLKEFIIDVSKK